MNEITRKASNALVATVDFFQGALAAEAQAGDAKQVQLDALVGQLKPDLEREEWKVKYEAARSALDQAVSKWDAVVRERDDLLLKCKKLRSENGALREVASRVRVVLPLKPGTKAYEKAREFLLRDLKALDG